MYLALGNKPGRCVMCGGKTRFVDSVKGYKDHCGVKCAHSDPGVKIKREETCLETYGVRHSMQVPEVKAKVAASIMERFGVKSHLSLESTKEKRKATSRERYGADSYAESTLYQTRKHEINARAQEARVETMQRRYGVDSPLQIREVFERQQRSAMAVKRIVVKGVEFQVQGYEGIVINRMVAKGAKVKRIKTVGLPTIRYKDVNNKTRIYYPDIQYGQTLVEVKSTQTLGVNFSKMSELFKKVMRKVKGAYESGYNLKLVLVVNAHRRGERFVVIDNPGGMVPVEVWRCIKKQL